MKKLLLTIVATGWLSLGLAISDLPAQNLAPIQLTKPDLNRGTSLMKALKDRKSTRIFSDRDLSLDLLSNLLWAASGINRPETGLRTSPTASNSQEIDIYVARQDGLFLYNANKHLLEPVLGEDIRALSGIQDFTQTAPVNLIYVADHTKLRASQEFYSATDTGFISQNVYLFCASEGLATVVLGWIDKPKLKTAMGLSADQEVILVQPVGYPQP